MYRTRNVSARSILTIVVILFAELLAAQRLHASTDFYLDCSALKDGNGTEKSPWNSVVSANATTLQPGDHLLLKRGSACEGTLAPLGSGSEKAPIVLDAYGSGSRPVVRGGANEEALRLFNQEYWEINNLEVTGGHRYGVHISGDRPNSSLTHIYLRDLDVHGATFESLKRADSGEVFISANAPAQILHDVLIDRVTAHDTHASEGIFVSAGGEWIEGHGAFQPLGSDVTVQNSTAHDVYGDGILISELTNGLLQHNVVYRSGLCPKCTGSTPVGLWQWYCRKCVVQFNESYANESWAEDGGDFDIDYFNDDNIVQYNYGHDSAGYCVAFFGAGGRATRHNIFRYNICSNNGRKKELSKQGEIYLHTWDGGSLDGVEIYNNTIYWNPAVNAAAFTTSDAVYSGKGALFFKNNLIYTTVSGMIQATSPFVLDHNIYWTAAASGASWQFGGRTYSNFAEYQRASAQDAHGQQANPLVTTPDYHANGMPKDAFQLGPGSPAAHAGADVCVGPASCSMGPRDFWGNPVPGPQGFGVGAYQGH